MNRDCHQPIVRRQIKQLLAVPPPAHLNATAAGDSHFPSGSQKWLHVDFYTPGFIRLVSNPPAIRRELRVRLIELSFNDRKRRSSASSGSAQMSSRCVGRG